MKPTSAAIKVGITAILIAVLGFMTFRFVAKGISGNQGYRVWCIFHDATGLVEKSRVQIAGLNIGQIIDRRLEGSFARITIKVKPETQLWSNATVFKKSASLLGEFYLEIDPGTAEAPDPMTGKMIKNHLLKDGDQIPNVVEAVSTSDILVQVNETLPVLRQILLDVQQSSVVLRLRNDHGPGEALAADFVPRSLTERATELGGGVVVAHESNFTEIAITLPVAGALG